MIKQDYVTWIQIALLWILKQMIFTRILLMMLINGLILPIMIKMIIDHQKLEKTKRLLSELFALRAKAYAYKLDDDTEMKKAKGTMKCIVKSEITFKSYVDALFHDK